MANKRIALSSAAWAEMPNVKHVNSKLAGNDESFLNALGKLLSEKHQTSRFAVTLLHSHFAVANDEFLGETFRPEVGKIETKIYNQKNVDREFKDATARSWKISNGKLTPLTYARESQLPQQPVSDMDAELVGEIVALYGKYNVEDHFGLAHPGPHAPEGMVWLESENIPERKLNQEQVEESWLNDNSSLRTMWIFDETGRFLITLGCCYRDKNGHQWRHANG